MIRTRFLVVAACAAVALPVFTAGAQGQGQPPQGPPRQQEKPKNLKYFPKDIPRSALIDTMETFTRALGVGCNFCHMVDDSLPRDKRDFASDAKQTKIKARTMLRMVAAINNEYLTRLPSRVHPPVVVSCATCHRGVMIPRPLDQIILTAYDSAGADSAVALYHNLRDRYYGRASYDFGPAPLADVGGTLQQRDKLADALKFYMLNLQYSPNSASAWSQAAGAQLASGDTAAAIQSFQKALSLDPHDRQATRALEKLKGH